MKKLIYLFFILLGFTSCMKDDKVTLEPEATDKVDIIFGVTLPEPLINTKVMGDNPDVQSLRVAVFGGSGYLKEYVQATFIDIDGNTLDHGAVTNDQTYYYKVTLSLSDSRLKVHLIANGPSSLPFKYEDEIMSTLTTSGTQDAYWQRIELPNGITAQKYPEDDPDPDKAGAYIKDEVTGKYKVTDETKSHFQDIHLIRNFAKIEVTASAPEFELQSYLLVNTPDMGSVAPYNKATGSFMMNYEELSFNEVKNAYAGNLPASATINTTIPSKSAFESISTPTPVYMYERPIPTQKATFLLVYGKYENKMCFYRIDLQDASGYYAIYRNFVYKIDITKILRAGADNPTDAANSAGSGDISTIQEAENLTDVSDGVARIFVEYTEKTIIGDPQTVKLKFKFLPDASDDTHPVNGAVVGGTGVEVTVGSAGTTGEVINGGNITIASSNDSQGYRELSFTSTEAGDATKTQSITITGHYMQGEVASKISRKVTFKLMKKQTLQVVCDPNELLEGKGKKLDVLIKIPKDLPVSIFPLQLKIESSKLSITPDNDTPDDNNLPVSAGKSIIDGTTASYYFIKTVSRDDYLALQEASTDEWVTITTHFKTTKKESDCYVYVANEYFNTDYDEFTTYTMKSFTELAFSDYTLSAAEMPLVFSFRMDDDDIPDDVTIRLVGLKPGASSGLTPTGTTNEYTYHTSGTSATINLLTSTNDGYYRADISAPHYYDAYKDNSQLEYINPKFTDLRAPFGIGKEVKFTFSYQPGAIEPVVFTLTHLKPKTGDYENLGNDKYRFTFTPTPGSESQEVTFVTTRLYSDVEVTSMSGNAYIEAGPFTLPKATSYTVPANALTFSGYHSTLTSSVLPNVRTRTLSVYTSSGTLLGTFENRFNTYNPSSFNIDLSAIGESETFYLQYSVTFYGTFRSGTYTLEELANATSSQPLDISGWTNL